MALIKCSECGTQISSEAENCPKCGIKIAKKMGCGTVIGILLLAFFAIGIISSPGIDNNKSSQSANEHSKNDAGKIPTTPTPIPKTPGEQWIYNQQNDEMSKGTIYQAYVQSTNIVNFDFPYSGPQRGTLVLRTHPRHGKDIIFRIEKGQFLCTSYEGCTVLIRFDDGEPVKYSGTPAADNSTETIFIKNYSKFVGQMLKAKKIRIAANIYKEGSPAFEFDVSDFDQNKYKPKSK